MRVARNSILRERTRLACVTLSALVLLTDMAVTYQYRHTNDAHREVRLITLDPGHFHASLVQKRMYPGVSSRVDVYAPLGPDLTEHLNRIARFNERSDDPTSWKLEMHTGPNFFEQMLKERPGNVVVISGRNKGKIDRINACIENGLNVLADKPWIINASELPGLETALGNAERRRLVAYDIMTERYEITTILQRELVGESSIFGSIVPGSEKDPGVVMEGVHHLMKTVAGVPNLRPTWFFDVSQQGEGLADTGTHLVDLVQWILFPEQAIDYRRDIKVSGARRWQTTIDKQQFRRLTEALDFPEFLSSGVKGREFGLFCNGEVSYSVRGVRARVRVSWDYEAPDGAGDTHFAVFNGSKSRIEIRQGRDERYRTELYVVPKKVGDAEVVAALKKKIEILRSRFPGLGIEPVGDKVRVTIPDRFRVGHEEHFAQVTDRFLKYFENPKTMPSWEKSNMVAKYYVTTQAVELSRRE